MLNLQVFGNLLLPLETLLAIGLSLAVIDYIWSQSKNKCFFLKNASSERAYANQDADSREEAKLSGKEIREIERRRLTECSFEGFLYRLRAFISLYIILVGAVLVIKLL